MRSNIHTHSTWCDGANTPREMAEAAFALGFTDLGFSSHAPAAFDPSCPGVPDEAAYMQDIHHLREEWDGRMRILCGLEQDAYAPARRGGYDYLIGSTHYLPVWHGQYTAVDNTWQMLQEAIQTRYGGDGAAMAKDYYALAAEGIARSKPLVAGHFDVVKKFNAKQDLFDEGGGLYRGAALEALDAVLDVLQGYGGMVEVNTGAMARGLRDEPYPAPFLLRHAAQRGARVIITSDSHTAAGLNACFEEACAFLRRAGFSSMAVLKGGAFRQVRLEA